MVKATRKKSLTIPQLRHAFDHIDTWVESHLSRHTGPVKELVPEFQKEWKKTFKRDVDAKSAEAYLQLKKSHPPRMTRKHKKKGQHGGAALAGAPLDYMTRQGVYGVYGHFPAYVSNGLSFYNQINNDSIVADCPKPSFVEKIPADMGSNQVGGATRKKGFRHKKTRKNGMKGGALPNLVPSPIIAAFERPFSVTANPSSGAIVQQSVRGQDIATPRPSDYTAPELNYSAAGALSESSLSSLPQISITPSGLTYQ